MFLVCVKFFILTQLWETARFLITFCTFNFEAIWPISQVSSRSRTQLMLQQHQFLLTSIFPKFLISMIYFFLTFAGIILQMLFFNTFYGHYFSLFFLFFFRHNSSSQVLSLKHPSVRLFSIKCSDKKFRKQSNYSRNLTHFALNDFLEHLILRFFPKFIKFMKFTV